MSHVAMYVLVVDDEPVVRRSLVRILEAAGHRGLACAGADEALARLTPAVDLVLSDVNMPGMDGLELATRVARVLGTAPPRTLLMSGNGYPERLCAVPPDVVIGLVAKPLTASTLRQTIDFLALTRDRCPGLVAPLCPRAEKNLRESGAGLPQLLCATPQYAACSEYLGVCGHVLRLWLAGGCCRQS
jgi:CheY-like chemotaxis protein